MSFTSAVKDYASTYRISPSEPLKTQYIDNTIDRARKPKKPARAWEKNPFFQAFNYYPSNYSNYEKWFLFKCDLVIVTFLGWSFFTKYLDNANIGTAYVSGMKEELSMEGNELNYINTFYTIGYAIFQIPITLMVTKPKYARYLLIVCEFAWGMLVLGNAFVSSAKQIYALRFFIGVTEACSYPAAYCVMSQWFNDDELLQRSSLYGAWGAAGTACSGLLQTRAKKALNGVNGLSGWRWQLIIDAIMTIGVAVYGFLLFPGIPQSSKKFGIFTEDDMTFARNRLDKKVATPKKFTKKVLKETFFTWQLPVFCILWTLHHSSWYSNGAKLWMKSRTDLFTTAEVTSYDSYMYMVGIPCALLGPTMAVWLGRMTTVNLLMIPAYYACTVLCVWDTPWRVLFSAFFMQRPYREGLAQLYYAWAASLCKDSAEKKALLLSIMQAASYVNNAWVITLQYNTAYAPRYRVGYIINYVFIALSHVFFFIAWFLEHYDWKYIPQWSGHRQTNEDGDIKFLVEKENEDQALLDDRSNNSSDSSFVQTESISIDSKK